MSAYKTAVLAMLNAANNTSFTEEQISLGSPEANELEDIDRNTRLTLTALEPSNKIGRMSIYYDRVDLADLVAEGSLLFEIAAPTNSLDLIAPFNERYQTLLTTEDVVSEALPAADSHGVIHYTFKMAAGSYAFYGSVPVTIVEPDAPSPP